MDASTLVPRLRMSRAAVFTVFGLNGFLCSMWMVHIPVITQRTGVSNGTLGLLILLAALGGIAGMQAAGPLADRFGSRTLVAVATSGTAAGTAVRVAAGARPRRDRLRFPADRGVANDWSALHRVFGLRANRRASS